jgi:excisionase family DNA binding protein
MSNSEEELLSIAELARYLGKSRQSLYQWRARGVFPFRTIGEGRGLKVAKSEVDEYLTRNGKSRGPEKPQEPLADDSRNRRAASPGTNGAAVEIRLAEGTRLEDAAELVRRMQEGAETSIICTPEGCVLRVS